MFRKKLIVTALGGLLTGGAVSLPAWAEDGAATAGAPDAQPAQQASDDAAAAAPKAVRANRGAAARETNLGTVTVTARRRKESIQDVPVAVTALSGDAIRNNELRVINDVTKYVPNFTGQSTEGRERPRWFLRGVGSNDPSDLSLSPIGVYFDDVYINSVFGQGFPLFDLDHIEVLRGPQGTLWGKNTVGGALSITSQKPTFDVSGYGKIGLGQYNSRLAEAAIGGPIGKNDVLAARVSVYHENADSFYTNTVQQGRFGGFHDNAVRFQVLAVPTSDTDFLFNIHGRNYTGGGNAWHAEGAGRGGTNQFGFVGSSDPYTVSLNAPSSDHISTWGTSLTAHWRINPAVSLTSITAFEGLHRWYQDDEDYSPVDAARSHDRLSSRQFSQEFRLESPQNDRLSWIVGTHLFTEQLAEQGAGGGLPGSPSPAYYHLTDLTQHTQSAAIFGSVKYRFTDRFNVTGGLRYTIERKTINLTGLQDTGNVTFSDPNSWWSPSSVSSPLAVSAQQHQTNTWRAPTWDLTPEYALSSNVRAYFRYARGFRSGGYNGNAYTQSTVSTVSPEYLSDYEVGIKSEWFDKRLIVNASVFHYDYRDIQVFALAPNPFGGPPVSTLSNAGQGRADGFELELKAQPVNSLYLFANLGMLNTRYTEFRNVPTAVGNSFARSPHTTLNAGVDYRVPVSFGTLTAGGDVNYRSREYFSATRQTMPQLWQGGYTVLNAHVSYTTPNQKYIVTGYVTNLTNKVYKKLELLPSYGAYPVLYGDPRTVGITLTAKI
ncbi:MULTISPECIES: TonB-dependent receptor [Burkholderia]|nr:MULTISPECIES: TonB-dependent receptor [Burkholderia]KIS51779.1 tonB dependent receptor family protein [Burkholderia cepacia]AMU11928.1 ligand-gated channel [Burkholderia cenocepacia]EPZ89319.1 TonB-dependent receptor [Burkholderia cenocepacia K56-2Valvano]ERI31180.1 TonB-dependent receptor [Burkholderia cenocepacia BC7]KKI80368.1 ligand-gated channel [Burkholderia cenocepacia]